jgi:hypothetical protein
MVSVRSGSGNLPSVTGTGTGLRPGRVTHGNATVAQAKGPMGTGASAPNHSTEVAGVHP